MKRKVTIDPVFGLSGIAVIVIDKNGMRVEEKSENMKHEKDDYFYHNYIKSCVDMDDWKHSWHTSIDAAMRKGTEERKKCREVMLEKIENRKSEIKALKDGIQILGRC